MPFKCESQRGVEIKRWTRLQCVTGIKRGFLSVTDLPCMWCGKHTETVLCSRITSPNAFILQGSGGYPRATLAPEDPDGLKAQVQSPLSFSKLMLFLRAEDVLSFLATLSLQKTQRRYLWKACACGRCSVKTRNYDPVFGATLSSSGWTDFPYFTTSRYLCVYFWSEHKH